MINNNCLCFKKKFSYYTKLYQQQLYTRTHNLFTKISNLPIIILSILSEFSHIFKKPTWIKAQILLIGAIITKNKRNSYFLLEFHWTFTSKRFEKFHRVLNRDKWNMFATVKVLVILKTLKICVFYFKKTSIFYNDNKIITIDTNTISIFKLNIKIKL